MGKITGEIRKQVEKLRAIAADNNGFAILVDTDGEVLECEISPAGTLIAKIFKEGRYISGFMLDLNKDTHLVHLVPYIKGAKIIGGKY